MQQGSPSVLIEATPEQPDDALTPLTNTRGSSTWAERWRRWVLVALALLAAFGVDWLLVPSSYPVAAAYGVSLILAAHLLASPVTVAALGVVALALSITSN